ncbi:MAG: hypothetical protein WBF34_10360 [Streptosporangiaceae bacterium]
MIADLQGYSFAKFRARYPSRADLFEHLTEGSATATPPGSAHG